MKPTQKYYDLFKEDKSTPFWKATIIPTIALICFGVLIGLICLGLYLFGWVFETFF